VGEDNLDIRKQQIGYNGKADDAEIYAPYGMSYNLPENCLCLYAQVGGDEGNLVVFPDRSEDRIKDLKRGEVAFFNPLTKTRTIYRQNGDMEIVTSGDKGDLNLTVKGDVNLTGSGEMNVDIATTNWKGDIIQDGTITNTQTTSNGIPLDGHKHSGSPSAPTGPVSNTGASIP
jgi:phage gp45-like